MAEWDVHSVPLQAVVLTLSGAPELRYFVRYSGFPDSAGTWEPRRSLNDAAITDDVRPLEARLRRDGENELREHHTATVKSVHRAMRMALKCRQRARVLDSHIVALCHVERLTFWRLSHPAYPTPSHAAQPAACASASSCIPLHGQACSRPRGQPLKN